MNKDEIKNLLEHEVLSNKELLDKCKEIIAKKYCYRSWDHYMANEWDSDSKERSLYDQVCELYATEKAKELLPKEKKEKVMVVTDAPNWEAMVKDIVRQGAQVVESSEPQEVVKQIGELKLYDRADGVKGHYCVGRLTKGGFNEYWTGDSFGGAGKLYETKDAAIKTLNALNSIKDTSAPVESQEELWKALIDMYDLTDASSYGYATLIKKLSQHFSITRLTP